jgi:peroxiredoxin Q/BCP
MPSKKISVGDKAIQFSLLDQNETKRSLKEFKGKKVLLYFYPKAMTPGCTTQACTISESFKQFEKLDVVVLAVSPDEPKRLKKFEERDNLKLILLSDPDHAITKSYGCFGLKKFMGREFMGVLRQSFLIDELGKIIFHMEKVNTKTHKDEFLEIIKDLG